MGMRTKVKLFSTIVKFNAIREKKVKKTKLLL